MSQVCSACAKPVNDLTPHLQGHVTPTGIFHVFDECIGVNQDLCPKCPAELKGRLTQLSQTTEYSILLSMRSLIFQGRVTAALMFLNECFGDWGVWGGAMRGGAVLSSLCLTTAIPFHLELSLEGQPSKKWLERSIKFCLYTHTGLAFFFSIAKMNSASGFLGVLTGVTFTNATITAIYQRMRQDASQSLETSKNRKIAARIHDLDQFNSRAAVGIGAVAGALFAFNSTKGLDVPTQVVVVGLSGLAGAVATYASIYFGQIAAYFKSS